MKNIGKLCLFALLTAALTSCYSGTPKGTYDSVATHTDTTSTSTTVDTLPQKLDSTSTDTTNK